MKNTLLKSALILLSINFGFAIASDYSSILQTDEKVELWARNRPETCEFVYRVESDLKISFGTQTHGLIEYQLQDVYKEKEPGAGWTDSRFEATNDGKVEFTIESFAESKKVLYRNIRFKFVDLAGQESFTYSTEFARKFGEACIPGKPENSKWYKRVLSVSL